MRYLVAGAVVATAWTIAGPPAVAIAFALAFVAGLFIPRRTPTPATITRLPTRHEQRHRRWGWAIGLGVTHWGPFPFITIYRRR